MAPQIRLCREFEDLLYQNKIWLYNLRSRQDFHGISEGVLRQKTDKDDGCKGEKTLDCIFNLVFLVRICRCFGN